jgi:hypothetical protein
MHCKSFILVADMNKVYRDGGVSFTSSYTINFVFSLGVKCLL